MSSRCVLVALVSGLVCSALIVSRVQAQNGVVMPLSDEDRQEINALLGPGVVGQALPSVPIQDTAAYFPLQERALNYQVTSGANVGSVQTLPVAKGKRPGGNSAWRLALSPSLAGFIRLSADGDLLMPAVSDSGEGVTVVTTPANPFILKGMKPGDTRTYTQAVSVN